MKNGYYISDIDVNKQSLYPGVYKKINIQIKEFSHTHNVQHICVKENKTMMGKLLKRIFLFYSTYDWNLCFKEINKPDFLYIRKPIIDYGFYHFLKKVKRNYPLCKIVLELYTYPYDNDYLINSKSICAFPIVLKERIFRELIHRYLNRIVTFSNDQYIWKTKTIRIINGIDVNKYKIKSNNYSEKNKIVFISVATMQEHHGYDRLIKGIADYYKAENVDINIKYYVVGNGPKVAEYIDYVRNNNLENYIEFTGALDGKKLDYYFDISNIAVGSLGLHRIGIHNSSTLKTREYLARGIPFIYSGKIDVIKDDYRFCLKISENEDSIDINMVKNFYLKMCDLNRFNNINEQIREFAINNIDISKSFMPVIDYINNETND